MKWRWQKSGAMRSSETRHFSFISSWAKMPRSQLSGIKYSYQILIILNRFIWPKVGSRTGTTNPDQSGLGSNGNKWVTPHSSELQNWSLTINAVWWFVLIIWWWYRVSHAHFPDSLFIRPYHLSLPASLSNYTLCPHITDVALAGRPTLTRPCKGVHRRRSLIVT